MRYVLALLLFTLFSFAQAAQLTLHVSPSGNDQHEGTQEKPIRTLLESLNRIVKAREKNPDLDATVLIHPGVHTVTKPLFLRKKENQDQPKTVFKAFDEGNFPQIVGGPVVRNWTQTTLNGHQVWKADLKPLGIKAKFHQLFLNGRRQIWARYPNYDPNYPYSGGWAYVPGKRVPMYTDIPGERTDLVTLKPEDAHDWSHPTEAEINIFPRYNWWNRIEKVKAYDPKTRTFTLQKGMLYAARPEDRFCIMGLKEELDAPGEWWQDAANQVLYFMPPKGMDPNRETVTPATSANLIHLYGVRNVTFRALDISCMENEAIRLSHCRNCVVEKSRIHDLSYMWNGGIVIHQGKGNTVRGCDIWNIGGHGISVHGGNNIAMSRADHVVENNYIHHVGQFNRHGIGISLFGVGIRMAHNLIHDTPRCGIYHGGTFNTLEYNRIRHNNLEMEDTGATYTGGGDWLGARGTVIRYNHISDQIGYTNRGTFFAFCWGIYLDENCGGCDVYGNLVERAQNGAMHLHNARDNHIFNNIFVNNGGKKGDRKQFSMQGWRTDPNHMFITNRRPKMIKPYEQAMKNPAWRKMRGMNVGPLTCGLEDGTVMAGNRVERNIFYYPTQPNSTYMTASNCNFKHNVVNRNLIWNGGKVPVKTGKVSYKNIVQDLTHLIANTAFKPATPEELKANPFLTAASEWYFYRKISPDAQSLVTKDEKGSPVLKFEGHYDPTRRYLKNNCIRSAPLRLEAGKTYRLTFNLRTPGGNGPVYARFVSELKNARQLLIEKKMFQDHKIDFTKLEHEANYWKAFGNKGFTAGIANDWAECAIAFTIPPEGHPQFDPRNSYLSIHFLFCSSKGWCEIADLKLYEVKAGSEWEGWQELGADQDSIVADPLFVNPEAGNYTLKPNSPALKLGFKPIPFEKIGPYKHESRASWPIVEAEGARENPQWLRQPPAAQ